MTNKVVVVTGGTSGIGQATAALFHERGNSVAIVGRNAERLAEMRSNYPGMLAIQADLKQAEEPARVVAEVISTYSRIDTLVNAHGILGKPAPLEEIALVEWAEMLDTNLLGPIRTTTAAIPALKESHGSVVNVASINAIQAEPWMAPYGVSKAALVAFTKYAAADLAQFGIRVNSVLPGWVRTPMAIPFFTEAGILVGPMATNFQQRAAEPRELGQVIAFLASNEASYITGESLVADGGHWINMRALAPVVDE